MIMRMSSLFVRTLREDPADAEVPSHRLLVRAGYIRRAAPGIYTWLPLGLRVLRKIENVIREEMDAIGAQEMLFPALLPREPYEATNRWTEYGDGIFRLQDRKGADYLLGPTHEEMFTLVVKDLYSSYKDLPLSIYQIQTKYRDEARPRAGLLRGREFVMKDSYSFDVDDAGLDVSYQKHRDAYVRIFDRLGFEYVIVEAMSGAMGGSKSEEFLAKASVGEDTYVRCTLCDYAANVEAVHSPPIPPVPYDDAPAAHAEQTPDTPTIETLVAHLNERFPREDRPWAASDTLKNVVFSVHHPDGATEALAVGLPGDREVDAKRLEAHLGEGVVFEPFGEADFAARPTLAKGYIGPGALGEKKPAGVRYLLDPRVVEGTRWVTGADAAGSHVIDLVAGRDFSGDGLIEVAEVRDGDPCPRGDGGTLETARGIEMGHIFQLGRKYADALDLKVLDEQGKLVTVTMGSYGIGPSRAVAAIAEGTHDELGLAWPREVAPADVHIVATGKDEHVFAAAERIAHELDKQGVEVLYDDRPKVSPGVKFKDAELIGVPTIVVVGKGLAAGTIEVKDRRTGQRQDVPADHLVDRVIAIVRA
ncbi:MULTISPECIES: proline--tRNA ligase [unclassified Nocardioides]|uniref:Proline--tRNA ligase n=1 Tax=Nocardioides sp. (strain ATCC BAA-499 / JS614) TaxID=196162 RepID=SYP_NOCSJ|nr:MULTISPECIES: proline--tRNA ligase [unclassified Nocardioides]A1SLL4.1 RecName: Full=Proline--tRNA ligase; AltName: Full=Prolyl-tRNA synthetase; Short=ProRS [Nocardioides sp. JS614]ABL82699.1 prolyl-tRNA synthetase [Nocardioides sp. JS614]